DRLIKCAEDARFVCISRVALEQFFCFFSAVAAEVGVQQVDHRPEVSAFLHIYLEQIAQIIKRRRRMPEQALLLDRCRLGVTLRDNQSAECGAILTWNLLPDFLAEIVAKSNAAIGVLVGQENPPTVLGHANVAISGPAFRVYGSRGAQVNIGHLEIARTEVLPPLEKFGLPMFERTLQC